jgi:hypothetical protein
MTNGFRRANSKLEHDNQQLKAFTSIHMISSIHLTFFSLILSLRLKFENLSVIELEEHFRAGQTNYQLSVMKTVHEIVDELMIIMN